MTIDPAVAPDGSPVALYLRLSGDRELAWIEPAIPARSSVLDLGCGVGRIGVGLVRSGHRVTGVDDSPEMLAHASERGTEPVLADLIGLDLGRSFDVVLLLSHLLNEADPVTRHAFWAAAADHVRPGGQVVIERFHPSWIGAATPSTSRRPTNPVEDETDEVEIELHDVEHRPGGLQAKVTYRIAGHAFTQAFDAIALDDAAVAAEAARHGLSLVRWLDEAEELGLLTTA
jgi:SAM-dependent methyltransferase